MLNTDPNLVLGFVIFSTILSLPVCLVVDLLYYTLEPRIREANEPILAVNGVTVTYPRDRDAPHTALDAVDLGILRSEIVGFIEETGADESPIRPGRNVLNPRHEFNAVLTMARQIITLASHGKRAGSVSARR